MDKMAGGQVVPVSRFVRCCNNIDLVVLLNGTMSFHRSRRLENSNDQPLIEFV